MKLSTSLNINNKSFTKRDIINISRCIYQELDNNSQRSFFDFEVICDDNTTYTQDNLEILEDGDVLDIKKITEIKISLTSYDDEITKRINLNLNISEHEFDKSIFEISGEKKWVTNVFEDMKSIFNSIKPQNTFLKDYKLVVVLLLSFSLGSLIMVFSNLIFDGFEKILLNINFLGKLFITTLLGFFAGSLTLFGKLLKLYPNIEFDFGPEHFNLVKKKRNIIIFIFGSISLAIIANIITNFIT